MTESREHRLWWVIDEGVVKHLEGWAAPDQYWWFPMIRFSLCEGYHVFPTRKEAERAARLYLEELIDLAQRKLEVLKS